MALANPLPSARPQQREPRAQKAAASLAMAAPAPTQAARESAKGGRLYEVLVRNLTGRRFKLNGPACVSQRKVPEGRLLSAETSLAPALAPVEALPHTIGIVLAPDPEQHASPTAQAAFSPAPASCPAQGIEFTLAYTDGTGEGFTIRACAHAHYRADVLTVGQELSVASCLEEVPRLVAKPPPGYSETALGVYSSPGRCEAMRIGELRPDDEVLAGSGPRQGRWLRITAPCEGWVQAETRSGVPLLVTVPHLRPHLRQIVTVRPRYKAISEVGEREAAAGAAAADPAAAPGAIRADCERDPTYSRAGAKEVARETERTYCNARAQEALRLGRELATLEDVSLIGRRPRRAL
eukprot:CAMPEP_0117559196 /NCGR_PEP_ID=MMETSP0784-20121206/53233_1 /TAXON_ID=39447 /ORGANISM="" /LENGTH=351 /DNA_ID=CAMNT_0005356561 /DNA_START=8 /DNA_END=1060 /DNA_ORIENTATION=+